MTNQKLGYSWISPKRKEYIKHKENLAKKREQKKLNVYIKE